MTVKNYFVAVSLNIYSAISLQSATLWQVKKTGRCRKVTICSGSIVALLISLRKQAYSNTLKISPPKSENFQIYILIFFYISAKNIDCGYSLEPPRPCGSNEYPQAMFLSKNKKNNVYPCKTQFYYIKMGFKGVRITIYIGMFL